MKKEYVLLNKEYCDEELADLGRDVAEIHTFPQDDEYKKLKPDEHGFLGGSYSVKIIYIPGGSDIIE